MTHDAVSEAEVEGLVRGSAPGNGRCRVGSLLPYAEALAMGSAGCERMEFLGDAVLSIVVTQYLYDRFPSSREGFLTKMRSKIVSSRMLSQLAGLLHLEAHVRRSTDTTNSSRGPIALDDILEAFIAAICLDAGIEAARDWFINVLEHHVDISALVSWHDTSKQRLVTLAGGAITFTEVVGGHACAHTRAVCVRDATGRVIATAMAGTRRDAEEDAARKVLASRGLLCATGGATGGGATAGGSTALPRHALALRASCG